jgi:hypothetical protein
VFDRTLRPVLVTGRRLGSRMLERRFGTVTEREVSLGDLGLEAPGRVGYKPTPWNTLARALPSREVGADDVFVDFGAGMGRAVVLAARAPFKRVVGVELSSELAAVARSNIERVRSRARCRDIEIVVADALEWEPPDDVTVAFFYNPFEGEVFERVVQRLLASVDEHPRRLRIVYCNPVEHERLMATRRVRLVRRVRGWRPTREWSRSKSIYVYEVVPVENDGR